MVEYTKNSDLLEAGVVEEFAEAEWHAGEEVEEIEEKKEKKAKVK